MELIYLGATLDTNKEHELCNITPKGFSVSILYTPESWIAKGGRIMDLFEDCTEVHHLFNRSEKSPFSDSDEIAFESDIRAEGYARKVSDIERVIITLNI